MSAMPSDKNEPIRITGGRFVGGALLNHETDSAGAFHSTKISGLRFEIFLASNGTRRVRTVSFHSTRKTSFALTEMEDVGSLVLVLELHDDFDGDISDTV